MKFAYDPDRSEANLLKHGINFKDAKALWRDPYLLVAKARFVFQYPVRQSKRCGWTID